MDYVDTASGRGPDSGGYGDPAQMNAWITGAQQRVSQGLPLDQSGQWDPLHGKFGTPLGYAVHGNQLVKDSMASWNPWVDLLGGAATFGAGALLGPTAAAAGPASGAAPAGVGPLASGETGMGATTSAMVPPADLAATGGAGTPSWLLPALKIGAPLAANAAMHSGGGNSDGTGLNGLNPDQQDLITQLLKMSMQRQQETQPVHQAAMALAGRMGDASMNLPSYGSSIRDTNGPGPTSSQNPQLTAAYQRLMNGGR